MQILRPISCEHKKEDEITSDDGEIVCGHCGYVKGRAEINSIHSESRTTLYIDTVIGGKPNYSISANRYMHSNSNELDSISNICQALDLPSFLSRDIWYWYKKIKTNIKMTKAKVIVLVFYQLCRYNTIPLNENQLLEKVKFYLDVKHVHTSLNVISEVNSFLDDTGKPIIENIGFANLTSHNINFLLASKIKSMHDKYSVNVIAKVEELSKKISLTLSGADEQIAKTAFDIAKMRVGIC